MKYLFLAGLLCLNTAYAAPPAIDSWIGHRYDDTRVLFLAADVTATNLNHIEGHSLPQPAAQYAFGQINLLPPERLRMLKPEPPVGLRTGDKYTVNVGGSVTVEATIDQVIEYATGGSWMVGAIAKITRGADVYRSLHAKYYLVRAGAAANIGSALVPTLSPAQLSSVDEKQLQAKLNDRVKVEARKLQSGSTKEDPYPKSWLRSDARLLHGDASLTTAVQSIQAGEEVRYFVKAQWAIEGKAVFLATAWVKPEGFAIQAFDSRVAHAMRTPELDGERNVEDLDKVLNAFDDGILIFSQEFESFSIVLYRYSPSGLVKTAVEFAQGV